MEYLIAGCIGLVILAFVYAMLAKSDIDIPDSAEVAVSEEEAEVYIEKYEENK